MTHMEMGSSQCENGSTMSSPVTADMSKSPGGTAGNKKPHFNRPKFFPCSHCGKKFTIRALAVHKQTCTGLSGCCCAVCANASGNGLASEASSNELRNADSIEESSKTEISPKVEVKPSVAEIDSTVQSSFGSSDPVMDYAIGGEENNCTDNDQVIQVSIVFPPPCVESTGIGNGHTSSPNYFVINQENEQCIASDVSSSTNGLLLLHEAGLLSMAGVKLEELQDSASNNQPSCNQNAVAQSIMLSLPHLAAKMNELNGTKNNVMESTGTNQPTVSPYSDRKISCAVCQLELPWEVFGSHVIHHAAIYDSTQLRCPKCYKSFNRSAMLLIHFYKHITNKSFVCKDCQMSFQYCDDLKSHTLNEHGYMEVQPFHCYICMRRFSHPQTIINHMRIHAKETPFKCNECNRSFSQIGNLQRHMSVHRGDRPHKCSECTRSFADPATLRNHVRIHTGETPFVCKVCMRGFTQIGNLKRHMARHLQAPSKRSARNSNTKICSPKPSLLMTDENTSEEFPMETSNSSYFPFEERMDAAPVMKSENANTFPQVTEPQTLDDKKPVMLINVKTDSLSKETTMAISQLKEQRRKQHWQLFPCPVCGKIYTWQHDLSIHFRIHTGEKPYNCDLCGKQFAQSGAVRTHKARHHNVISIC